MKNAKAFNLKNMKETLVNYSVGQEEFDKIWDTFYQMFLLGFISRDTWVKFSDQCTGWYVDEENGCIRDARICLGEGDFIVWEITPYAEYRA